MAIQLETHFVKKQNCFLLRLPNRVLLVLEVVALDLIGADVGAMNVFSSFSDFEWHFW